MSKRGRRVTAQDVADKAGVSRHAVSRCFRKGTYLSENKRRVILAAADELGYRPNALATSLKGGGSQLVGIVSGNISNFYDTHVISGLVERLTGMGKWPVVLSGDGEGIRDARVLDVLSYPLEAMIVRAGSIDGALAEQCGRLGIPLILSGARPEQADFADSVVCENARGAGLAARCFVERKRDRIAYVGGPTHLSSEKERFGGFVGALSAFDMEPAKLVHSDFSFHGGEMAAAELFDGNTPPDAIFCSNDAMALGVLSTAREIYGVSVPDELSVIGFDDIPMASWPVFQLTTVRNSITDTVDGIMQLFEQRLEQPEGPARKRIIKPELVLRNSH